MVKILKILGSLGSLSFLYSLHPFLFDSTDALTKLSINGVINQKSVDDFLIEVDENLPEDDWLVYFNTGGGHVLEGVRLLPFFQQHNVTCIASKAYSMGFVLYQACSYRYMEEFGSLMMHDMKLHFHTDFSKAKTYLKFINKLHKKLTQLQTNKIGIPESPFFRKIYSDWWMDSKDALRYNCADEIILKTMELQY